MYQRDFGTSRRMHENEYLRQASTFHALFCMAQELCPVKHSDPSGIQNLRTSEFQIECLHTLTGTKFFLIASLDAAGLSGILNRIYRQYSDFVLKNPFHVMENVIQSEKFTHSIETMFMPGGNP